MATKKKAAQPEEPPPSDLNDLTVDELKDKAEQEGVNLEGATTKAEIIERLQAAQGTAGVPQITDGPIAIPEPRVDPSDFADPDPTKPVINVLNGKPVEVIKIDGKAWPSEADACLILIQDGQSQEILTHTQAALRQRFWQDINGQVYYYAHGQPTASDKFKPLSLEALDVPPPPAP